ncbi:hypothetical protein LP7551_02279 [Roseibium album]|nr:hypothetical protein LP7551_02279 [Roseibium album]
MESVVRNMRLIWRAELLIIEAKLNIATKKIGATAFAGLIFIFGLGMLNVAGFFALEQEWGPVYAALGVAIADFLIAALLLLWGSRLSTGPELELAKEVRDAGLEELEAKAEHIQDEVMAVRDELLSLKKSLTAFSKNPLDGTINSLLTPILTLLIKSLSKGKN